MKTQQKCKNAIIKSIQNDKKHQKVAKRPIKIYKKPVTRKNTKKRKEKQGNKKKHENGEQKARQK